MRLFIHSFTHMTGTVGFPGDKTEDGKDLTYMSAPFKDFEMRKNERRKERKEDKKKS